MLADCFKLFAASLLLAATSGAFAEYVEPEVDWKEGEVAAPPAYDVSRLIPIESARSSSLALGIDPNTLSAGADGVVRYVLVATSPQGTHTALFEGIRCGSAEFRTYARRNADSDWVPAAKSTWQSLFATLPSAHALAVARAGVCVGKAANTPLDAMVRSLRQSGRGR